MKAIRFFLQEKSTHHVTFEQRRRISTTGHDVRPSVRVLRIANRHDFEFILLADLPGVRVTDALSSDYKLESF
jgi:hypothetical protein